MEIDKMKYGKENFVIDNDILFYIFKVLNEEYIVKSGNTFNSNTIAKEITIKASQTAIYRIMMYLKQLGFIYENPKVSRDYKLSMEGFNFFLLFRRTIDARTEYNKKLSLLNKNFCLDSMKPQVYNYGG
jgi:DNA-binding IclR family transcriptional regulator